jgi:hypothetical protein
MVINRRYFPDLIDAIDAIFYLYIRARPLPEW